MSSMGPLTVFLAPTLFIFASVLSLAQFKIAYIYLEKVIRNPPPVMEALHPGMKRMLQIFESVLGSPSSFNPSLTHVLLVALIMAILTRR